MRHTTTILAAYALTHPLIMPALDPRRMFRFDAESDPEPQPQPDTDASPAGAQNADKSDDAGEEESEHAVPISRFNEVVNELKALKADAAKTRADTEKAEQERLAKQGEWQKLAESAQEQVADLEIVSGEMADLTEKIAKQMNAEIADWPDEVKALAPEGDDVSPVFMLDWLERHRPLAAKLAAPPAPNGNGPGPKPRGTARKPEDVTSPINVRRTF